MAKTLGFTKKVGKDWFESGAYSDHEIESIKDPEGGSGIDLPTSIPSPFARMDVVKTAFRNIAKTTDLKALKSNGGGNAGDVVIAGRNDERLVSHCLDLCELLFNKDRLGDKLQIIVWDRKEAIEKLKSGSLAHKRYGETLELYLNQDAKSYNFDLLKRLYLIVYDHAVIGGTSPITLFFPTANSLKRAQTRLVTNDTLFDDDYVPLYERDEEFQRYFHLLVRANPAISGRMKDVNDYVQKSLAKLQEINPRLFSELNAVNPTDYFDRYDELDTGNAGEVVEIIDGFVLRKQKSEDIGVAVKNSDFLIRPTKTIPGRTPLVLQNNFSKPFRYVKDVWDPSTVVPFVDTETRLEQRQLPGVPIRYPYLTVSDFLEPYLIRLVYPVNSEKFFDGNCEQGGVDGAKGYLLPLKTEFFKYFNANDLMSSQPNRPSIQIVDPPNLKGVKVVLKIPVVRKNEFITFERVYYSPTDIPIPEASEEQNKGGVIEQQFGMTLFPFMKTNNPNIPACYRIHLVDRDSVGALKDNDYDLQFYSDGSSNPLALEGASPRPRSNKRVNGDASSKFYLMNQEFDFIQVKSTWASGVAIPRWPEYQAGRTAFSFAVDFGTTNTHIEYKAEGGDQAKPFDITRADIQIATLYDPNRSDVALREAGALAVQELIEYEFVPELIGEGSDYRFPHRTVLAESNSVDFQQATFGLADFNIPFIYERKREKDKIQTNLKWARRELGNDTRVLRFLENLALLIRNKVLLNNGDLSQTKIIWSYPSSMSYGRRAELGNIWAELCNNYFGPTVAATPIIESLAPFYYYKGSNLLPAGAFKPAASIDIGGGTTDITIFKSNQPLVLTSFKFAANSLFGDGFSESGAANGNGLVNKYSTHFNELFDKGPHRELKGVLRSLLDKNRSEDINAFLFSIENNPKIEERKLFSYNNKLSRDEDLKIVFLYFYAAIIFHLAELMKSKKIELPSYVVFSGTGSKILNVITSDMKILADFSKLIFAGVCGNDFDADGLTIKNAPDPKEITCRGALMTRPEDLVVDVDNLKAVLTCLEDKGVESLTVDQLDEGVQQDISEHVKSFNSFFLGLDQKMSFVNYFNVSPQSMAVFKEDINKHLRDYLKGGIEFNRRLNGATVEGEKIQETLFFYPIIGAINSLATKLSALTQVST